MTTTSRPRSAWGNKQPWGTILKPDFEMGTQKMTSAEVEALSERLHQPIQRPAPAEIDQSKVIGGQKMPEGEVDAIVERLCHVSPGKEVPDCKRTGALKESGIQNSFAWKGWN